MTDSQWEEEQQDREISAWVRFLVRLGLGLSDSAFVSLVRIALRFDRPSTTD